MDWRHFLSNSCLRHAAVARVFDFDCDVGELQTVQFFAGLLFNVTDFVLVG